MRCLIIPSPLPLRRYRFVYSGCLLPTFSSRIYRTMIRIHTVCMRVPYTWYRRILLYISHTYARCSKQQSKHKQCRCWNAAVPPCLPGMIRTWSSYPGMTLLCLLHPYKISEWHLTGWIKSILSIVTTCRMTEKPEQFTCTGHVWYNYNASQRRVATNS